MEISIDAQELRNVLPSFFSHVLDWFFVSPDATIFFPGPILPNFVLICSPISPIIVKIDWSLGSRGKYYCTVNLPPNRFLIGHSLGKQIFLE